MIGPSAGHSARRYWTAARVREAKPLPLLGDPGVSPTARRSPGAAARVQNHRIDDAREFPLSTNGRLLVRYHGYGAFCSGTSITTPSHRVVLTAAHCLYDPQTGEWGHFIAFVPAYSSGKRPFGTFVSRRLYVTERWARSGSPKYDVGAFLVSGERGRLSDVVGARGIASGRARRAEFQIFGYPAGAAAGQTLRECDGPGQGPDLGPIQHFFPGPPTVKSNCRMARGSSGGGWIVEDRYVSGVTSYGNRAMRIRSPYFGSYIWRFVQLLP